MKYLFTLCEYCKEPTKGRTIDGMVFKENSIGIRGVFTVFLDRTKFVHAPFVAGATREQQAAMETDFCDYKCIGKYLKEEVKKYKNNGQTNKKLSPAQPLTLE